MNAQLRQAGAFLWGHLQALRPSFLTKEPHFNFITAHYFWVIGWTIVGSVLLFATAGGDLFYVDALFFASGANTQAGLNTIDVNLLNTFQQAVIMLLSMMSNPMTINTFVVYLRLYWFEKKFQNVVKEARSRRVTLTKSRSKAKGLENADVEKGVNGRSISVMHGGKSGRITNDGILLEDDQGADEAHKAPEAIGNGYASQPNGHHRDHPQIKFADQVRSSDSIAPDENPDLQLPSRRTDAEHIAILERQRNESHGALRIPGPRDAERGVLPEEVDDHENRPPNRFWSRRRTSSLESPRHDLASTRVPSNHERPHAITIEEPARPKREELADNVVAAAHTLGVLKFRKPRGPNEKLHHSDTEHSRHNPLHRIRTALSQSKEDDPTPYLSYQPTLGRNSEFLDLTETQREELGGIEYRSLKTLAGVLAIYFWGFWVFGVVCLLPWILVNNDQYGAVVDNAGQNRTWWGFFTSTSAFMDLGFTLTADSMISFADSKFVLLIMSFLIIIGNTGFPIMLRFTIWFFHLLVPRGSGLWEELRFLLDHPRRCFTLLFPSTANWWLLGILVVLNGIDLIFFVILDLNTGTVAQLPLNIRFLDGWFQAASTRTAGFAVVNLAELHPAIQTSYLIMMYISVFPIAISVRRTNVYEERALGLYGSANVEEGANESDLSYVGAHLRRQLSFDLWFIFIAFFILSITEGPRLINGDFSMFAVLFEIVSAYGTVGLSLGYTGVNASLCSQFTVIGKLVLIATQIRGRHRGLPYGLDKAVLLPSESLIRKEAEMAEARMQRRQSAVSLSTARPGSVSGGAAGRSRSVDRRRSMDRPNVLMSFLHPGPVYHGPLKSHSHAKTEHSAGLGTHEPLRRVTTEPPSDENEDLDKLASRPQPRRPATQPILPYSE